MATQAQPEPDPDTVNGWSWFGFETAEMTAQFRSTLECRAIEPASEDGAPSGIGRR